VHAGGDDRSPLAGLSGLHPAFSASCMQHVSDLHPKFTLRPHHVEVWQTSNLQPLRLGEEKRKKKPQDENIMVCPIP